MRFYGEVGFVSVNVEVRPGVFDDLVLERKYYGEVIRDTRQLENGDKVNNDISVSNSISIVADDQANANIFDIRYVMWRGKRWSVPDVQVASPRLILRLGGVYNGPTPPTT